MRDEEYLRPAEVATLLRVHVSTVFRAMSSGALPSVRRGPAGGRLVPRSGLNAYLRPGAGKVVESGVERKRAEDDGMRRARRRGYDV